MDGLLKRSFAPIVDPDTRLLVLGSLPGERSLAQQRYYGHPRNQFWTLIGTAIGRDLAAMDYADRLAALLAAGVGLWDVIESATRPGSLDGAIRNHSPNRLPELAASLPRLEAVAFNGGTAARIGRKSLPQGDSLTLIDLPSSSPAYTLPLAEKSLRWAELRRWINENP